MLRRRYIATIVIGKNVLIREGIAGILRSANFRTLNSVSCVDDLPPGELKPQEQLAVMIHTGDEFDPVIEQLEFLRDRNPNVRIAIVTDHYRLDEIVAAFRAGAHGYFIDVMTRDAFIKSIELLMMGETIFPPASLMSYALEPVDDLDGTSERRRRGDPGLVTTEDDQTAQPLSPREKSVLRYLIAGDSNKSIARKIDVAEATVKAHVKAILRKIRVQNRTQAAIWGMNHWHPARSTNTAAVLPPPAVEIGKRPFDPIKMPSSINQIEASPRMEVPPSLTNHIKMRRLGRLPRDH
ncbi:LuxR C-terminal-related transcriptional regulator [Bradyrhizobium liaoningense]|uniref:LuxR C-terminal-related transcriptional regulator n=1 Tax=Bradyrhizobium liaoningense TaxID=43992 RepID=UPI001BA6E4DA|nr:response regulator transcription factor [Bradyrhizobium liaoningense]MBR0858115.1 response regulator transcription factor [Bradyrhizobium liaoningense]